MPRVKAREQPEIVEVQEVSKKRDKVQIFQEKADQLFKRSNLMSQRMNAFLKSSTEYFVEMKKDTKDMLETLEAVKKTNEEVDSTLCKVLLAIRQNEYLQAWHPEHDVSNPFIKKPR